MGTRGRSLLSDETVFFITTTVVEHTPIFNKKCFCDILISNIKFYQRKYEFIVLGYVIMPTHFHWIISTAINKSSVSNIMRDIKKFSAWQIFDKIEKGRYNNYIEIFSNAAKQYPDQIRKLWVTRFDDEVIRSKEMFWVKLNYIHNNPVKANIVLSPDEYLYSSYRNYQNNDNSILYVDTKFASFNLT